MTEDELEGMLCTLITTMGLKAVRSRECKQAPAGTYYSVGIQSVDHAGTLHETATRDPLNPRQRVYQNVANVAIWEVEGKGEGIRAIRNRIDTESFRDTARAQGVAIWTIGSIIDLSNNDDGFWIRQKRMEIVCAFNDYVNGEAVPIESVEVSGPGIQVTAGISN